MDKIINWRCVHVLALEKTDVMLTAPCYARITRVYNLSIREYNPCTMRHNRILVLPFV